MSDLPERLRNSVLTLLRELLDGPPSEACFVLNPGDRGLLASLDAPFAEAASERPGGRSSVAAHVDHLRYGFELMNRGRAARTRRDANFAASWERQHVDEEQWRRLRAALAEEVRAWMTAAAEPREWDDLALTGTLASAVHLAVPRGRDSPDPAGGQRPARAGLAWRHSCRSAISGSTRSARRAGT